LGAIEAAVPQNEWITTGTSPRRRQFRPARASCWMTNAARRFAESSVFDPSIEGKIEILHLMESLGIDAVNIGLPAPGHVLLLTPKR